MSEIRVGSWNAACAFMQEDRSRERMEDALEVAVRLNADVLAIQELGVLGLHGTAFEEDRLGEVRQRMKGEGYAGNIVPVTHQDYRQQGRQYYHRLSLWARDGKGIIEPEPRQFDARNGLVAYIPELDADFYTTHGDDKNKAARVRMVTDVIGDIKNGGREAIVACDFNDMSRRDSSLIRRGASMASRLGVGRIEVDYYNGSRVERYLGYVARTARMDGQSRREFEQAGFNNANAAYEPTCRNLGLAISIDDIYVTPALSVRDFEVHSGRTNAGQQVSDHHPITAIIAR